MNGPNIKDFHTVRHAVPGVDEPLLRYIDPVYRPRWMSDEQWAQIVRYTRGEAIPTDQEIIDALQLKDENSRGYYWAYRNVPGCFVGKENHWTWCKFIEDAFDVGL